MQFLYSTQQTRRKKRMIKKMVFFLLLTGLLSTLYWLSSEKQAAPNVTFTTITGKKITLTQFNGNPIIINFWATDCPSCIQEIPHLIDLYDQYHKKGLEIIAVAMYYAPPSHVVTMSKMKQIPYFVALDLKAEHAKAFGRVQLTPTTFLISPKGNIVYQVTGKFDISEITHYLDKFTQG